MKIIYLIITIILSGIIIDKDGLPANLPKFIDLEPDYKIVAKSEKVFTFSNPDKLLTHDMYLLRSADDLPLMYYADIQTPVCIDNLCKPVFIEVYWDLLGNYAGYGEFPDERLSKFDHDIFEDEDYSKLHNLLGDPHSIMGKRPLHKLYDIGQSRDLTIKFKGVEVDAVSGATRKEIKNEIVDGALYSCHKLWRIAYGAAVPKIQNNISSIYNNRLVNHLLNSQHQDYHLHALKLLTLDQIEENIEPIIGIFKNANALTRSYILKKMPKHLFSHTRMTSEVYSAFSNYDNNSKTLLISHLQYAESEAVRILVDHIPSMSRNHLKEYLNNIRGQEKIDSNEFKERLQKPELKQECAYYYLVESYLKES